MKIRYLLVAVMLLFATVHFVATVESRTPNYEARL